MNSRNRLIGYAFSITGILTSMSLVPLHVLPALAQNAVPTPTYDPFAQPTLPPNPTDLELGRYLYWRHCMPCHGDMGQGLTDEFRILWEDHQNCWDRGCHGGKKDDEGFRIPTVVPAIVTEDHLRQFASEEELFQYLRATHPPQHPGYLEDEEYHDLAIVLFKMNRRSFNENVSLPTASPSPTSSLVPLLTSTPAAIHPNTEAKSNTQLLTAGSILLIAAIALWVIPKLSGKNR